MIVSAINNTGHFSRVYFPIFISSEVYQPSGSRGPGVWVMSAGDHLHHGDGDLGGDRLPDHYRGQLLVLEPGEEQI